MNILERLIHWVKGRIRNKTIKYTSDNGFTGYLYGESSMSIGIILSTGQFIEYFHTGSRNGNTKEYLKEMVDTFPEFVKAIGRRAAE